MSVLVDFQKDDEKQTQKGNNKNKKPLNRLLVKGAANMVVDRCTHIKYRDGSIGRMTNVLKKEIDSKITDMATRPLRCIALAIKEESQLPKSLKNFQSNDDIRNHPLLKDPNKYEDIESGLTLVGIVGIKDPARPEVADSILK